MKWFLGTVCGVMVVVILVVMLFVYVQVVLAPPGAATSATSTSSLSAPRDNEPETMADPARAVDNEPGAAATPASAPALPKEPVRTATSTPVPASIALSSLPLSDTQKKLLGSVGIDPETFVITPDMIACANDKLGEARMAEIVGGSAPGALEMASLLRCL